MPLGNPLAGRVPAGHVDVDLLDRDIGAREVLTIDDVRFFLLKSIVLAVLVGVALYIAAADSELSLAGRGFVALVAAYVALMFARALDRLLCLARSGYSCSDCVEEDERWRAVR